MPLGKVFLFDFVVRNVCWCVCIVFPPSCLLGCVVRVVFICCVFCCDSENPPVGPVD